MTATPGAPDLVAVHDGVAKAFQKLVAGVRPEQWSAPTPCTEWDVRMLVNHVVSGNLWFVSNIVGTEKPDRSTDFLGDDPAAAFADSAATLHDAFVAPGTMQGTFPSPIGNQPGPFLVQMRITEQLVHGWDLAHATGQTMDVPEALAEQTLSGLRPALAGMPREGGPFKEEKPVRDDAPALDRLAAFLGRAL